jgi:ribosomal protein L11 methyltransferase
MSSKITNPKATVGNSHWLATISVPRDLEEQTSALLFDLGSTGIVTLEESADAVTLEAYFESKTDAAEIRQALEADFQRTGSRDAPTGFSISAVPEQDWMQKWKEGFEPVQIGERLMVAPSWTLPEKKEGRIVIQIDPGMAFGTGTHETTRLCLEAIERHWRGRSLLDVGTGTGILAIAAALLEPGSRVVAIEIDPQAVEVARENLAINGVLGSVELLEGQPGLLAGEEFDVVVANLTAEVIIDLVEDLESRIAAGGYLILSGILVELAQDVEKALAGCGLKTTERREAAEWCALVALRA